MLKRVGVVMWWLGLIVALFTVFGLYSKHSLHQGCDQLVRLGAVVDVANEKLLSVAPKQTPADPLLALVGSSELPATDPRDTPALRASLAACARGPSYSDGLMFVLTAILWGFAYVLGGRFWTPPKAAN